VCWATVSIPMQVYVIYHINIETWILFQKYMWFVLIEGSYGT